ncbi:type IV pilus modification PilV family protein [Psychromonas ossibalaenae]|uniref:type IV pilus modification PilV family protein n=1 Tax=Psychromonas ossibalaenae TaxID=444922 RepID=UPI00036CE81B|nr:prepilin-type N-terminal cleavage/methylation domain-containing protein [Psychromonas ossibalaenae]
MKKTTNGFALFEVLIAMFITGVALLALAKTELYILKSSQSSFNYTVATIRGNSFIDTIWLDLCNAQKSTSASTYIVHRNLWLSELSAANMTADSNNPPAVYTQEMNVTISWSDSRFIDDDANNTVTMAVKFPDSGCG